MVPTVLLYGEVRLGAVCGGINGSQGTGAGDLPPSTGPVWMLVHCRFLRQAG